MTVAFEDLARKVVLTELDEDVASVWQGVLNGMAPTLVNRILSFEMEGANVRRVLACDSQSLEDRAFATLLRNRVQHGGILAPGASLMKQGENGKGLASRWYPVTLANRIRAIAGIKDRIEFRCEDGFRTIREFRRNSNAVFFVDPPYTIAGKRLYRHCDVDHEGLFALLSEVTGDLLVTYDDTEEVRRWAQKYGFQWARVAMKTRQNRDKWELLIGRNLAWAGG